MSIVTTVAHLSYCLARYSNHGLHVNVRNQLVKQYFAVTSVRVSFDNFLFRTLWSWTWNVRDHCVMTVTGWGQVWLRSKSKTKVLDSGLSQTWLHPVLCKILFTRNSDIRRWDSERERKIRAITPFKVIQGHRLWYQSNAHVRLPITLLASNIGSILDQYVAQYWLHIVRNIYPILDSSHFNNIGPILTINIGPI